MSRKRVPRYDKPSKVWSLLLIFFILVGLISLIYIIFVSDLLKIKTLEINLSKTNCANSLDIRNSTQLLDKKLFLTDLNLEKRLIEQFPCIKKVTAMRIPPGKIVINISGREAIAVIKITKPEATQSTQVSNEASSSALLLNFPETSDAKSFVIDEEGIVFDQDKDLNLPTLFLVGNLKLKQKLEGHFINAVVVLNKLKVLGLDFKNSKVSSDILVVDSTPKLIFNLRENINNQLASLQLILEKAKMEDITMEFIDLRFENPVVKYRDKNNGKR